MHFISIVVNMRHGMNNTKIPRGLRGRGCSFRQYFIRIRAFTVEVMMWRTEPFRNGVLMQMSYRNI